MLGLDRRSGPSLSFDRWIGAENYKYNQQASYKQSSEFGLHVPFQNRRPLPCATHRQRHEILPRRPCWERCRSPKHSGNCSHRCLSNAWLLFAQESHRATRNKKYDRTFPQDLVKNEPRKKEKEGTCWRRWDTWEAMATNQPIRPSIHTVKHPTTKKDQTHTHPSLTRFHNSWFFQQIMFHRGTNDASVVKFQP